MTKAELHAERKRTELYLADQRHNTPSVIYEASQDVKTSIKHLDKINTQLLKIEKEEAKAADIEKQKLADSLAALLAFKDRLLILQEDIDSTWHDLHHLHRSAVSDMRSSIGQLLRNHKKSA